jgi:hypothetical protein
VNWQLPLHSATSFQDGFSSGWCQACYLGRIHVSLTVSAQRLARFLDRPLFPWKKLIVGFSVAQYLFEGFLSLRQYQVLKNTKPPKVLEHEVSKEVYDKSQVREKTWGRNAEVPDDR